MKKPCRLELNNTGAWKLLGRFDADDQDYADDILTAAGHLVDALNASRPDCKSTTLRIVSSDGLQSPLMVYRSREVGWRDWQGNAV